MSLFVNTNTSSLNATRQLFNSNSSLDKSFQRLSSGFRINSAADDAAGLQISDRMTSQVMGLKEATKNANHGISVVQTAESALKETTRALQRIRQLAVQSQSGINSIADKEALDAEVQGLLSEINRINETTQFAGINLLDGSYSRQFLVGANAGQNIAVSFNDFIGSSLGLSNIDLTKSGIIVSSFEREPISMANLAPSPILNLYAGNPLTKPVHILVSTDHGKTYSAIDVSVGTSLTDAAEHVAEELGRLSGVNAFRSLGSTIYDDNGPSIPDNVRISVADYGTNSGVGTIGTSAIGIHSSKNESDVLGVLDGALSSVAGIRAEMGALENRFRATLRSLSNIEEKTSAARSQITDTDYALETANLTKHQIIQQAATSVLAQANTRPQIALTLLQN